MLRMLATKHLKRRKRSVPWSLWKGGRFHGVLHRWASRSQTGSEPRRESIKMLQTLGWRHTATSICAKARGISAPNLVIRSRFYVHGPSCTSLVLCARLTRFSDSVSALGAEVLVTCSVTTWKALQPSTILKWPLLFPAAAWYNQQVTLHDVRIFFPPWHSIASSTWKESHWDALVAMTTNYICAGKHCFCFRIGCKLGFSHLWAKRNVTNWGESRSRGKLGLACKRGYYSDWLLQQQTQFASKWIEAEEFSKHFQAFFTTVLHFGGFRRSYSISCTLFLIF